MEPCCFEPVSFERDAYVHRVLRPRALQLTQWAKIAISAREKPRNLEGELSAAFRRRWWRWPPGERGSEALVRRRA